MSAEHFSVDGTLLKAWASMKSFRPKDGSGEPPSPGRNGEADFRKTKRSNETHASTTDKDARLFRKGDGQESRLGYLGHALMENRNGLVAAAEATLATGTAEREAAERLSGRLPKGATLGADKGYDVEAFIEGLKGRGIAPHVAINGTVSKTGKARKTAVPPEVAASLRLRNQPAAAQAHRGGLRLDEDSGRACASESARPRQGPRRLRLRHCSLQYRAPAQASGSKGRRVSGGLKKKRTMNQGRGHLPPMNHIQAKNFAPNPLLAETQ